MTEPPLLRLAAGKKARPRKAAIPPPKELALHIHVAKLLKDFCSPDWKFTHIPSGELRNVRTAVKLKAMGLKRGWPDFILINREGRIHCLELKRVKALLTDDQNEFRFWCIATGVPYVIAWSVDQVLAALEEWQCLTVKVT